MTRAAAVAAGNSDTAAAAATVLRAGGNAVDAAVAAGFASAVTEPGLSSLGGGGFLLTAPLDGPERLLDFFVDAPGRGRAPDRLVPSFLPVTVRFSGADQVFHAGWGSVAVPGCLDGYLHAVRTLGSLPLAQVVAPAVALARGGTVVDAAQAHLLTLLEEILVLTAEGRAVFAPAGRLLGEGDRMRNPALGDLLEDVGRGTVTGMASLAGPLQAAADRAGGLLTADDLAAYAVREREPLRSSYRGARLVTNPPPSFGGVLVLAALAELAREAPVDGSPAATARLAEALVRMSERHVAGPRAVRGTTHVSVVDGAGGLAAMTMSNGSCSGVFAPGTGIQLNNVMGEADLHPAGFSSTPPGVRIGSMMAPTLLRTVDGTRTALGSGGSERIRSALLCALTALVDRAAPLADAVRAPRLHWDRSVLQVEPGLPAGTVRALRAARPVQEWQRRDLYFGGVHAVALRVDGSVDAAGDPRRAGAAEVVPLS
ncbi:MAG: Gamma-glutamyltranspeptidase @ Glutathione hydrolase [uncultured Frankineae bacterium]|uniref:Gamma-glutamyltranspeptidase @ Glutathione hydrolase n=1 Tax=uncultured Frankineae bacterium TaxID=437475 RepID=A0A6J4KWI6_9ACTN|nr:MAG: Gamma-glutamyltranspeptidase @ Glutathione hydrolase [uncultured Frankineae bacterium]